MSEPYVGEIRIFSGDFAPVGWELCDGRLLAISEYETLYTLIGTTYGGDGQTTFALPDLRGRIPLHMGQNQVTGTTYTLGQSGGTETVTLTLNQIPPHNHPVQCSSTAGNSNSPGNAIWALSSIDQYSDAQPQAAMSELAMMHTGGNLPHDNMMPYLTVNYIISLYGIYPSQN